MQNQNLQIVNSAVEDLDFIFSLFTHAIAYQRKNGHHEWPQFSRELITQEINDKRHWKIVDGETVVCIFSVLYSDPVIWGDKDNDPSVYLHRIAINPGYKGRNMIDLVKNWALEHAREKGKTYLRMDTWGTNVNLRNYYISRGFNYLGQQELPQVNGLPPHYGGAVLSLFQIEVSSEAEKTAKRE